MRSWNKSIFQAVMLALLVALICYPFVFIGNHSSAKTPVSAPATAISDEEAAALVKSIVAVRNKAMLDGDQNTIVNLYNKKMRNGLYASEHEVQKLHSLHSWAQKQGVTFQSIVSDIQVNWANRRGEGVAVNFIASTEYRYSYDDRPDVLNTLRIGTYHEMSVIPSGEQWLITKEWYTDPFADSLHPENTKADENRALILSHEARDFASLIERRRKAVEYADRYCGAANPCCDFKYNPKYRNYNPVGGDCANFVSQALYEGGKFKKSGLWNYDKGGNIAWIKARNLKDFMLYSGRASLLASGSYNKVLKASYKLLPGDLVCYAKKGKIVHVSMVSGADSRGYTLVTCHNTDRYHVPWDLGWNDSGISFVFVRVHY